MNGYQRLILAILELLLAEGIVSIGLIIKGQVTMALVLMLVMLNTFLALAVVTFPGDET